MTETEHVPERASDHRPRPGMLLLLWFLALAALAGAAPMLQSLTRLPYELLSLVMVAPALASLVVLIRPLRAPQMWRRTSSADFALASLLGTMAVLVFFVVLVGATGWQLRSPDAAATAPIAVFLAAQALGVLGEELGWRGFVQRWGEELARPMVVSAVAGLAFGATHLGMWPLGVVAVGTFAATAMLMSLTITTIFRGSLLQRLVPAVVVHLGVNLTIASIPAGESSLAASPIALAAAGAMFAFALLSDRLRRRAAERSPALRPVSSDLSAARQR